MIASAPIHVRLKVFSGVPDPRWMIDNANDVMSIRQWFADADRAAGPTRHILPPGPPVTDATLPVTGYRGFDVTIDGVERHVYQNALVTGRLGVAREQTTMDQFLFATHAVELRQQYGLDLSAIEAHVPQPIAGLAATCDTANLESGDAYFHPSSWVDAPFCNNTCYGYAANVRTDQMVTPADSSLVKWSSDDLTKALLDDGLDGPIANVPSAAPNDPEAHYIVALLNLYSGNKGDYHFLRLDHSGCWSQKMSTDPVNQRDDSAPPRKLTNLCTATFASDFTFVGVFIVNDDVRQRLRARGNGT